MIMPLNSLKHPKYKLKSPIYITIETDEDFIIASFNDIEVFAYADTEPEAINQLCDDIVLLYEDLKSDRENLGKLPQKWLICLEELIECACSPEICKLAECTVMKIRNAWYKEKPTYRELSRRFGVSSNQIGNIVKG